MSTRQNAGNAVKNKPRREPLSREAIVTTAVSLADQAGVGALTMRKLAGDLGFEVMSLYNHVSNKDELLSLMVDAVAGEVDEPPTDQAPTEAIRALAIATRSALIRHPWAPALWQRHVPGPARTTLMELLLRLFDDSGLAADLAHHGFHAVNNHVLGYTLQELEMAAMTGDKGPMAGAAEEYMAGVSEEEYPHFVAHIRAHLEGHTASSFELVLDLILDGLVRLNADR